MTHVSGAVGHTRCPSLRASRFTCLTRLSLAVGLLSPLPHSGRQVLPERDVFLDPLVVPPRRDDEPGRNLEGARGVLEV